MRSPRSIVLGSIAICYSPPVSPTDAAIRSRNCSSPYGDLRRSGSRLRSSATNSSKKSRSSSRVRILGCRGSTMTPCVVIIARDAQQKPRTTGHRTAETYGPAIRPGLRGSRRQSQVINSIRNRACCVTQDGFSEIASLYLSRCLQPTSQSFWRPIPGRTASTSAPPTPRLASSSTQYCASRLRRSVEVVLHSSTAI